MERKKPGHLEKRKVREHQSLPSQYISMETPYRGLLLYHGLGSGKTRTAIDIAETGGFNEIIVILPASLKSNFEKELETYGVTDRARYVFIHSNGLTRKVLGDFHDRYFDDKLIIIDEVHNLTSGLTDHKSIKSKFYKKLLDSQNSRFVLLSGTPMINHPVEIAHIVNLLRGEQSVYSIAVGGTPDPNDLLDALVNNEYVLNSESSRVSEGKGDYWLKFTITPRDFIKTGEVSVIGNRRGTESGLLKLKKSISVKRRLESIYAKLKGMRTIENGKIKLLNSKFKVVKNYSLPVTAKEFDELFTVENSGDIFKRRVAGSVSYYMQEEDDNYAKTDTIEIRLDLTLHQYNVYKEKREEEIRLERSGGLNSVYKVYSRAVCNFAFPSDVPRPFPKDMRGRAFVNSGLDTDSAATIAADESLGDVEVEGIISRKRQYRDALENSLKSLGEHDGFIKDLEDKYSPKFYKIYEKVKEDDGTAMIYSDFRAVEGVHIMKMIFERKGIGELRISKDGGDYRAIFPANCTSYYIHYGSNSDRVANDISLHIFNNEIEKIRVHERVIADLESRFGGVNLNKIQLAGKVVKAIFLTRSGSEGISLRNVRGVHIIEPYWNSTREKQVIGRAIRMNSHQDLKKGDRRVRVYKYISVFSEEQKNEQSRKSSLLHKSDKGLTSDELVQGIAANKSERIARFEHYLKEASIDCRLGHMHDSEVNCLNVNEDRMHDAQMYTFSLKDDAVTVTLPHRDADRITKDVLLVKFSNGEHEYRFLYVPSSKNLYDADTRRFSGTMRRISKSRYKVDLVEKK